MEPYAHHEKLSLLTLLLILSNESLQDRIDRDLAAIYYNPDLVRSFFSADSVVYAKD